MRGSVGIALVKGKGGYRRGQGGQILGCEASQTKFPLSKGQLRSNGQLAGEPHIVQKWLGLYHYCSVIWGDQPQE